LGFGVQSLGFRVWGLGFEVWELGYRVENDLHLLCEDIEDQLVPFEQVPRPLQEQAIKRKGDVC